MGSPYCPVDPPDDYGGPRQWPVEPGGLEWCAEMGGMTAVQHDLAYPIIEHTLATGCG